MKTTSECGSAANQGHNTIASKPPLVNLLSFTGHDTVTIYIAGYSC